MLSNSDLPALKTFGRALVDPTDHDEAVDVSEYRDVKLEMFATGHNLTSVLMNPRETVLQNLFDDFANEQSLPLEYQPVALNTSLNSSQHFFGFSSHSAHTTTATSSSHSISTFSSRGLTSASQFLSLTQTEIEQLERFVLKTNKLFEIYEAAHFDHDLLQAKKAQLVKSSPHFSTGKSKRLANEELRNCYREVPEMFFQSTFTLANQEMFNQAYQLFEQGRKDSRDSFDSIDIESDSVIKRSSGSRDVLSYYLDIVEVALLRQIWSKSTAFFRALDDLKGLQFEVYEAIQVLMAIRRRLTTVNERVVKRCLMVPKLSKRQSNVSVLQQKLQFMRQLVEGRAAVITLLQCEDYYAAQELIYSIKDIYWNHLREVKSVKVIGSQLQEFQLIICEVLCNKLATYGMQWEEDRQRETHSATNKSNDSNDNQETALSDYLIDFDLLTGSSTSNNKSENHSNKTSSESKTDRKTQLILDQKQETQKLIMSLIASEQFHVALNLYRNRLVEGVKLIIRTCVMEYMTGVFLESLSVLDGGSNNNSNTNSESDSEAIPFVQRVREMSPEHFLSCLSMCFEHLSLTLQKAHLFNEYLHEVIHSLSVAAESAKSISSTSGLLDNDLATIEVTTSSSTSSSSFLSSCTEKLSPAIITDFLSLSKGCLSSACEIVQKSIVQLINYRKDINAKFSLEKMLFLWEISSQFVKDLEVANFQKSAYPFRQCLLMQTKLFLDHLHEQSKNRLAAALDHERWIQTDVFPERQVEIDRLSSGKAFLSSSLSRRPEETTEKENSSTTSQSNGSASTKKSREKSLRSAVVEGQEYKVVWSVLLLTEIVLNYLDIAFHFSPVTDEILRKVVSLIQLFNSRTKSLVLGAQAIQSAAALKSISAKHLAMTGQSLALFIVLLPHIRAALFSQIPPNKQTVLSPELDRISQELFDHHALIMSKFVSIVADMIESSATNKLKAVENWDHLPASTDPSQQPGGAINNQIEYFEEIQRNIITLHKVISSILPSEQIQDVFSRIFSLLVRKIPHHFEEILPSTIVAKQVILGEVTIFVSGLSRLKSVDCSVLSQLEEMFRNKYKL